MSSVFNGRRFRDRETLAGRCHMVDRKGKLEPLKRISSYFHVFSPGIEGEVSFRTLIQPYWFLTYLITIINGPGTVLKHFTHINSFNGYTSAMR